MTDGHGGLHRAGWIGLVIGLYALAAFAYRPIFGYPMSTGDTWALLIGSRISDWPDALALFTTRLLDGTGFGGDFYRPVARLSYALDQLVWRDRIAGYYLTNVLVHGGTAILVAGVARLVTGRASIAVVAGVLVTLHPLAIEVVPSIARRQDLLAAFFGVASIAAVLRWSETDRTRWLVIAALAYAAGLASKEIAVFVPLVALAWLVLDPEPVGGRQRLRRVFVVGAALAAALGIYLLARALVIDGFDGYQTRHYVWGTTSMVTTYVNQLLVPQGLDSLLRGDSWARPALAIAGTSLIAAAVIAAPDSRIRRWRAWLAFWALCPLLVCVATGTFSYRSIYSGIPPVCLLIADSVARSLFVREASAWPIAGRSCTAAMLAIAIALVGFSPLFHAYPHWRTSAETFEHVFGQIDTALRDAQRRDSQVSSFAGLVASPEPIRELELVGLPRFVRYYRSRQPAARSVSYYHRYVLNARLRDRGHDVEVVAHRFTEHKQPLPHSWVMRKRREGERLEIEFAPADATTRAIGGSISIPAQPASP